jgi:predicted nucleic acid-binding protein
MKLFIDTNVVVDYLSQRQPFFKDAEKIFLLSKGKYELCISSLSFTTIYYILHKLKDKEELLSLLDDLQNIMNVLPVDGEIINQAIHSGFSDFEDAVQYFSALYGGADCIITRDKTGFAKASIPVINPKELSTKDI